MEELRTLQEAVEKALAAAARASSAAEVATSQARAAAEAAAQIAPRTADKDQVQQTLKGIPYVGAILAFVARHMGLSATGALIFFLGFAPLAYPVLAGVYLRLLPERAREIYATTIMEDFGFDKLVQKAIADQSSEFIAENNKRIDFVQQFQQVWNKDSADRSPAYRFPLSEDQEFTVTLTPRKENTGNCQKGSTKVVAATGAINDESLFSIKVLGKKVFTSPGVTDTPGMFIAGERFWKENGPLPPNRKEGVVQIMMNENIAPAVWECWTVSTDLTIVVHKTLRNLVRTSPVASTASAPARP